MSLAPEFPDRPDIGYRSDGVGPFAINDASALASQDRSWRSMTDLMRADAEHFRAVWSEPLVRRAYPGLFIAWSHRLAHTLHLRGARPLAMVVMWACHALTGAEIRPAAVVGPGLVVVHPTGVVVGGGTVLGARVQLMGGNLFGANLSGGIHGSPRVGDDVVIGAHALVLGPVVLGDRVTVGAASLVISDVEADTNVKGSPAR